jgi:alkanesulfonate monooxygenase
MHKLDHEGKYLSIAGPLNIARPVQGWPVIVQAGASDSGRQLAAEVAEVIFAAGGPIADARAYYADIKSRAAKAGRDPSLIKILPGALVTVAETDDAAREKRALLDSLVHPDSGMGALSIALGVDARGFDLDAPLPEIPETNQSQSGRQRVLERARRENLTVRQLAVALGGYGGLSFTGSAKTIADEMQHWLESDACDGFNIMFPTIPGGVEDFVRLVVPELQRRGIFRREYAGTTLRDHLGLPRPRNQFF